MKESLALFLRIYLKLALLAIAVGTAVRIVLLFNEQTSDLGFTPGEWLQIFLLGAVNDLCALTVGFFFLWLFAMSLSEGKYRKPWGYLILAVLTVLFSVLVNLVMYRKLAGISMVESMKAPE